MLGFTIVWAGQIISVPASNMTHFADDLGLRKDRQSDRARGHDHLVHPALSAIIIVLIVYLFIPTIRDLEDRLPDHGQMAKLEEEPAPTETGCA